MLTRPARMDELPQLQRWLNNSGGEVFDLRQAIVFVAEEDGEIVGMLPARMVWQLEPLLVSRGTKVGMSRAALMLFRAVEGWLASKENVTGVRWYFAITRSRAVRAWADRLGWHRQYKGATTYLKHLQEQPWDRVQ